MPRVVKNNNIARPYAHRLELQPRTRSPNNASVFHLQTKIARVARRRNTATSRAERRPPLFFWIRGIRSAIRKDKPPLRLGAAALRKIVQNIDIF